jgi:hypothetical protein
MMRNIARALTAALFLFWSALAATAAGKMDASTFSCKELTAKAEAADHTSKYGASVLLYWMAGYHQTEDQGTVVDFDNMVSEFEATKEFCSKNPAIGVMTASQKFMGEHSAKATEKAVDLSLIKCDRFTNSKESESDDLGELLMWLQGYHTSTGQSTMIDMEQFGSSVGKIAVYCVDHPETGLFTASEKYMAEPEDDSKDDSKADSKE